MNLAINHIKLKHLIPIFIFIGFFVVYVFTTAKHPLNYADSDDLTLAAYFGTTAHPPGYPILTLALHPLLKLVEPNQVAHTANLANALISALMLASVYLLLTNFASLISTKSNKSYFNFAAIVATTLFGLSTMTWRHATVLEVFPLSQLFLTWFGLTTIIIYTKKTVSVRWWLLLGFLAALNGFHHQLTWPLVIIVAGLLLKSKSDAQFTQLKHATCGFVLSLIALFLLYHLTNQHTVYGWGIGENLKQLIEFYFRLNLLGGGSAIEQTATTLNLNDSIQSLIIYFKITLAHFGLPTCLLIIYGFWGLRLHNRNFFMLTLGLWLLYGPAVAAYLKFPAITPTTVDTQYFWGTTLVERMLFVSELLLVIPLWAGLQQLVSNQTYNKQRALLVYACLAIIIIYQGKQAWQSISRHQDRRATDHAHTVLNNLPQNAILLADSDVVFSLLYQQLILGKRPDVTIIPTTTIMRDHWFTNQQGNLYKQSYPNRLDQALDVIQTSIAKEQPVHLYDPDPNLLLTLTEEEYSITPAGWTLKISPPTDEQDPPELTLYPLPSTLYPRIGSLSFWHQGLLSHQAGQLAIQSYYLALQGHTTEAEKLKNIALQAAILPATKQAIEASFQVGTQQHQASF